MKDFFRSLQPLLSGKSSTSIGSSAVISPTSVQWVLPGQLAIGRLPTASTCETLAQANIQVILSLCAPAEGMLPEIIQQNFECVRYILPDSTYAFPLMAEHLATAVGLVHQNILMQKPIYVHCLAGIQRSPTVCIAYLCRHHQLELWEALNCIRQVRPHALPTDAQLQVIREFLQQSSS